MRNRLALLTLFFGGVLFGTASCGKDEATGEDPSTGHVGYCEPCDASSDCASGNVCRSSTPGATLGVCAKSTDTQCCTMGTMGTCHSGLNSNVGSGGTAGSGGIITAGKGGKGGSGGSGGAAPKTHLGQACVTDGDCVTEGLKCITDTSLPGQQGPAGGLCTLPCTSNGDCLDFVDPAYCYTLGTTDDMYCVEGCPIGDALKCHERDNVACTPLTNQAPCASDADCGPDGVCDADSAICVFGGCVPTCAADSDCSAGQACDFSTGLCAKMPKKGAEIGAPCDPADDTDPCAGFCVRVSSTQGMCSAGCTQNSNFYGCGFDGTDPAQGLCAFVAVSAFTELGDQGLCGALCDCNADCKISGWGCFDIDAQFIDGAADYFKRPGVCQPLENGSSSDLIQECPAGSGGGAGGEGSGGSSGTGGSGGKGGTGGTGGTGSSGEGGESATSSGGGGQGGA